MKTKLLIILTYPLILTASVALFAENIPIVQQLNNPAPGYYFFDITELPNFQLYDNYGQLVHQKETISKKRKKILENGLIAEFEINKYFIYNKNIELIDSIANPTDYTIDLHDFVALRNGHYLMILNHKIEKDLSNIVQGGQKNALIINNLLVETDGRGNILWSWSAMDYLEILDVTEAVDLTMNLIDLFHINSVFEDSNGNLLISIRHYDEVALINKQTKQFIWRFGGQKSKKNQFTILNDEIDGFKGFSHQHTASLLSNGNVLLFDNGNLKPTQYSRAVEYSLNHQNKTATKVWEYRNSPDIYIFAMGSAYRLENGNTLIGWAKYGFTEVRPDKTITIQAVSNNPNGIYRVQKTNLKQTYSTISINSIGTYNYNNQDNITGITVKVESINGNGGKTHIQKHYYPPFRGTFSDNDFQAILPYRWVYSHDGGFNSISGEFQIDPKTVEQINFPQSISIYKREGEDKGNFQKLQTQFDATNNIIKAKFQGFGEFVVAKHIIAGPKLINPTNGQRSLTTSGQLIWERITGAKNYQIQISVNNTFDTKIVDTLIANQDKFNFGGLNFNQQYFWRVRALADVDTTEWSEIFTFRTNIKSPKIIYPTYNYVGFRNGELFQWDSVAYADSFQFQLSKDKSFQNLIINLDNQQQTILKATGLEFNTTYYCRVRSIASPDTSEWSNFVQFTTTLSYPKPIKPEDGAIDLVVPITFAWQKVKGAEVYYLELSESENYISESTRRIISIDTFLVINNFDSDTQYFWRLKSVRSGDSSDWSQTFEFTTQLNDTASINLNAPEVLKPKNNEFSVAINGIISWSKVNNAKRYKVNITDVDNKLIQELSLKGGNTTSTSLDNLKNNTKYIIKVKATSGYSESEWSKPVTFTTELVAPNIIFPKDQSTDVPEKGSFNFMVEGESFSFHLQTATDILFENLIIDKKDIMGTNFEYEFLGEKTYYARIKQYNDSNSSRWSEITQFTTQKSNSVFDYSYNIFKAYQNMESNFIVIETEYWYEIEQFEIYDLLGNKLLEFRPNTSISLIHNNLTRSGLYFLILKSKNKQMQIKTIPFVITK